MGGGGSRIKISIYVIVVDGYFLQDTGQFGQSIYGVCFVDTTIGKFQVNEGLKNVLNVHVV